MQNMNANSPSSAVAAAPVNAISANEAVEGVDSAPTILRLLNQGDMKALQVQSEVTLGAVVDRVCGRARVRVRADAVCAWGTGRLCW